MIDTSIARLNRNQMVNIICDDPEPNCNYIIQKLHNEAIFYKAKVAYTHQEKFILICVLKLDQEIKLRRYIRDHVSSAFVLISDSSLIFGKGFADIT